MSRRQRFGATWWGGAWIDALEQRARLDPNRLPRGRTYARQDRVSGLTITPGAVDAEVRGSRAQPYHVRVRVRPFTAKEWDRVLDAVAARAAHAAALLDGELPAAVLADAQAVGVDLLPTAGEVGPRCTCPDWADPCKHAAAVCYLVADALDADPFALLHLRGRPRDEVLAAIRERRRTAAGPDGSASNGPRSNSRDGNGSDSNGHDSDRPDRQEPGGDVIDARDAYAKTPATVLDLLRLAPPAPAATPGRPAPLVVDPPPGIDAAGLARLAADAAARAWALAGDGDGDGLGDGDDRSDDGHRASAGAGGPGPGTGGRATRGTAGAGLDLDHDHDLARWAATLLGEPELAALARRAGVPVRRLAERGVAWARGGAEGLDVVTDAWDPLAEGWDVEVDEARHTLGSATELAAATPTATVRLHRNRLTRGPVQLRLGRQGRWYRFARVGGAWELVAGPAVDPADLLATADGSRGVP